ncbi:MAG: hypothetical protein WCO65_03680 [bacterium]
MIKKISLNILIILLCFFVPYYLLGIYQTNILKLESTQNQLLFVILIGGSLLLFINHGYRKQALSNKWVWFIFEIIGVVGVLYSGIVLWLIFAFRHLLT